jgi:hypothetical protein
MLEDAIRSLVFEPMQQSLEPPGGQPASCCSYGLADDTRRTGFWLQSSVSPSLNRGIDYNAIGKSEGDRIGHLQ